MDSGEWDNVFSYLYNSEWAGRGIISRLGLHCQILVDVGGPWRARTVCRGKVYLGIPRFI